MGMHVATCGRMDHTRVLYQGTASAVPVAARKRRGHESGAAAAAAHRVVTTLTDRPL